MMSWGWLRHIAAVVVAEPGEAGFILKQDAGFILQQNGTDKFLTQAS